MRLKDRVAIVTGGGYGLGATYARFMAREGAVVTVSDLDFAGCEETARSINAEGGQCYPHPADLTDPGQVERLFAGVLERHGRVDILVNNAGGDPIGGGTSKIEEVDVDHWDRIVDVNLKTAFLCCKAAATPMKRQGYGKIVNVSSRAARSTGWFGAVSPEYSCSKAGVLALTRHVAKELGPHGINVNTLVPSFTISGPRLQQMWDAMAKEEQENMLAQTPLRRLTRPEELANVVLFLVSDDSSYITGATIDVNGGSFMG